MTFQFGKVTDPKLDRLSDVILTAQQQIDAATIDKDLAWEKVLETFLEFDKEGKEARFIASNGHTLAPTKRNGSPKLDQARLKQLIFEKYGQKAARIWSSITTQVVDSRALELAVQGGKVDAALVEQCITEGNPSVVRNHPLWTKEDAERAEILGIEKKEI